MSTDYRKFVANRKRRDYSYSVIGSKRPADLLKRPSRTELLQMIARFERDGEVGNAMELAKLL